jgi:hypothetical protein
LKRCPPYLYYIKVPNSGHIFGNGTFAFFGIDYNAFLNQETSKNYGMEIPKTGISLGKKEL